MKTKYFPKNLSKSSINFYGCSKYNSDICFDSNIKIFLTDFFKNNPPFLDKMLKNYSSKYYNLAVILADFLNNNSTKQSFPLLHLAIRHLVNGVISEQNNINEIQTKTQKIMNKLKRSKEKNLKLSEQLQDLEIENIKLKNENSNLQITLKEFLENEKEGSLNNESQVFPSTYPFSKAQNLMNFENYRDTNILAFNDSIKALDSNKNESKKSTDIHLLNNEMGKLQNKFIQMQQKVELMNYLMKKKETEYNNELLKLKEEKEKITKQLTGEIESLMDKQAKINQITHEKLKSVEDELRKEKAKLPPKPVYVQIDNTEKLKKISSIADSLALFISDLFNYNEFNADFFTDLEISNEIIQECQKKIENQYDNVIENVENCRDFLSQFSPETFNLFNAIFPRSINQNDTMEKEHYSNDPFLIAIATIINAFRNKFDILLQYFDEINQTIGLNGNKENHSFAIIHVIQIIFQNIKEIKSLLYNENTDIDIETFFDELKQFIRYSIKLSNNVRNELLPFSNEQDESQDDDMSFIVKLPRSTKLFVKQLLKTLKEKEQSLQNQESLSFSSEECSLKDEKIIQLNAKLQDSNDNNKELEKNNKELKLLKENLEEQIFSLKNENIKLNSMIKEKSEIYEKQITQHMQNERAKNEEKMKIIQKQFELQAKALQDSISIKSNKIRSYKDRISKLENLIREMPNKTLSLSINNESNSNREFIINLGKTLDNCFKKEGNWNSKLIINAVSVLVNRVLTLEKQLGNRP